MGCYHTVLDTKYEFSKIRDLGEMEHYFQSLDGEVDVEIQLWGNSLRQRLDIPVADLTGDQSRFHKFVMPSHKNKGVQDREY